MSAPGWYPNPAGGPGQRYFDGQQWTEHHAPLQSARSAVLTERERAGILDHAIISAHCRVLNRTATAASVVTGEPVNHVLHAILSLFLCGLWVPVWIIIASTNGEKHLTVSVDEYGTVRWIAPGGQVLGSAPGRVVP